MKEWTKGTLETAGYTIENVKITSADLSMADHSVLTLAMGLEAENWSTVYGGLVIGKGYLGAEDFEGAPSGIEYLMRIMDTIGVERFNNIPGKYARVATKGWGDTVKIIGNVIEDKWFDAESFFKDKGE